MDDSHSSEEFMYVRGTPTKEKLREMLDKQTDVGNKVNTDHDFFEYEGLNEADVWSTHEDKVPVAGMLGRSNNIAVVFLILSLQCFLFL